MRLISSEVAISLCSSKLQTRVAMNLDARNVHKHTFSRIIQADFKVNTITRIHVAYVFNDQALVKLFILLQFAGKDVH